jgi:iron(III) transport system permease protein
MEPRATRCVIIVAISLLLVVGLMPVAGLNSPASRQQLGLSLGLAAGAAALSIAIGLPLAVALARLQMIGKRFAWLVILLLLLAPLYVHLAGWDAVGGWLGWFGRSAPQSPLSGIVSSIWVHGLAAAPWSVVLIAAGLAQIPRREEELALLDAPPLAMFLHIILPRLWPWIAVAGSFAAVSSWQEMTVTNVYLVPTVTEGIYNQLAIAGDAFNAAVYPVPALVVFVGLLGMGSWLTQWLLTADFPADGLARMSWNSQRSAWVWSLGVWLTLFFLAGVPLLVLIWRAGLQTHVYGQLVTREWSLLSVFFTLKRTAVTMQMDFAWTFIAAASAATLATVFAMVCVWWARPGGWRFWLVLGLATLLFAVPGPLVGVAIIKLLNNPAIPGFTYLYDRTITAPVLAQAARAIPFALIILWHALAHFDRRQLEAAALDGYGPWRTLWSVVLPQRWPAIVAVWGLAMAISVGDVTCSLLVLPPGMDTVARRLFGNIHSGVDDQVAGACLLLMAIPTAVGAILWLVQPRSLSPRSTGARV